MFDVRKKTDWDTVFLLTVGVLLAWSLVAALINTTTFSQNHLAALARVLFLMCVFKLMFSYKRCLWIIIPIVFISTIIIAIGFLTEPYEPRLVNVAANFIRSTIRYIQGNEYYSIGFERVIVWAITAAVTFFVAFFGHLYFKFFILFPASAAGFSLLVTSSFFNFNLAFYVFAFCSLAFLIKYLNQRCSKKSESGTSFIHYALYITISCMLLALLVPVPRGRHNIAQTAISRPFHNINDSIYFALGPRYFSLRHIGFGSVGSGGRLGGDVVRSDRLVMNIRSDSATPIYLTGAVMNFYSGEFWANSFSYHAPVAFDEIYQNIELIERITGETTMSFLSNVNSMERATGIRRVSLLGSWLDVATLEERVPNLIWIDTNLEYYLVIMDEPQVPEPVFIYTDAFESGAMDIAILNYRTFSVFQTGIVHNIFSRYHEISFMRDASSRIVAEERMPRNAVYTIIYSDLSHLTPLDDYGEYDDYPTYRNILKYSYRGLLRDIRERIDRYYQAYGINLADITVNHNGIIISYEELLNNYLIPRADWVFAVYTTLPEEFPERVRDLARAVTAGAESDYERARMLEEYLSQNYRYTLTPGAHPPYRDFVDNFLFDLQEGYCTYFASAFVTMARSLGMPARYVEGFMVSGFPDEQGFMSVLSSMGHAWGEVYFEGFGWVRFEPTPSEGFPVAPLGFDFEDWDYFYLDFFLWDEMYYLGYHVGFGPTGTGTAQQGDDGGVTAMGRLWYFVAVVSLLLAIIFARSMWVRYLKKKVKGQENNEAVIHSFGILLKYMKFFNFEMEEAETAEQFAKRIGNRYKFEGETLIFADIAEIFSKARYSAHTVSLQERKIMENAVKTLDDRMQNIVGKRKHLVYKYILGAV